jgi:hypothetical protein
MKIKNHYAKLCFVWIFTTLIDSLACVVNFVEGNLWRGFIFLILSISFSFVSGILLNKAIAIYRHNKVCDFLKDIHEFLREQTEEKTEPFEEFKGAEK